jgi:hypothetical protein
VRWRIEQADEFRQEVEHYAEGERVILADAYQALLRHGPVPHPSSPLVIHRLRDPRAGDAYALVLPMVVVGYQCLGMSLWFKQPTSSGTLEGVFHQLRRRR